MTLTEYLKPLKLIVNPTRFKIMQYLYKKKGFGITADTLVEELRVSKPTILRNIQELSDAFLVIETKGFNGTHYFLNQKLKPQAILKILEEYSG